jgi:hypothetical protein
MQIMGNHQHSDATKSEEVNRYDKTMNPGLDNSGR